jgi:hypothetical protein
MASTTSPTVAATCATGGISSCKLFWAMQGPIALGPVTLTSANTGQYIPYGPYVASLLASKNLAFVCTCVVVGLDGSVWASTDPVPATGLPVGDSGPKMTLVALGNGAYAAGNMPGR